MREYGDNLEGGGNMVILVYPNVRNVVVSGQWENNCSNNVPNVLINTQIINTLSSGVTERASIGVWDIYYIDWFT